ncbi:MAG TPA: hypothetical protein VMF69_02275 [Gemmataceae bacterium]|nr:hypothetical protein [Gemmataceae bacterium]
MSSPGSVIREEISTGEAPASPPVRYPLSARRYLLTAFGPKRPRPDDETAAPCLAVARSRQMKRGARLLILLWLPFWYVIGQLLLFAWMDESWQMERTFSPPRKLKLLHQRLAETPDRPLVLMLGSSRSDQSFQAGRLTGQRGPDGRPLLAFNLGLPAAGGMHHAMYLNDLLAEGIRPRLLLVELVPTHLNRSRRGLQSEEHFTLVPWISAHELLFLQRYYANRRQMIVEWLEARLAPWYGFRWSVHEHMLGRHSHPPEETKYDQSWRPIDPWGWRLLRPLPNTPEFRTLRWMGACHMYALSLQNFQLGAKPAQALYDLFSRCRREKIPVALVLMPVSQDFQDLYCSEGRAQLDNFIAELRKHYNLDIIDATDWLDKEDFDDGHHPLLSGADKFTTKLIPLVHELLARTEPKKEDRRE